MNPPLLEVSLQLHFDSAHFSDERLQYFYRLIGDLLPDSKKMSNQIAFYASTPSYRPVMELHGWSSVAEKLSAHAARAEWTEMPTLITDEILTEFCLITDEDKLSNELKRRYEGIADRLTVYTPFVPGERDEWWRNLAKEF